jgi:hypothetical protein
VLRKARTSTPLGQLLLLVADRPLWTRTARLPASPELA